MIYVICWALMIFGIATGNVFLALGAIAVYVVYEGSNR